MKQHLASKTMMGLLTILLVSCIVALAGKLSPELTDIIKTIVIAFASVRGVANYSEAKRGSGQSS